MGVDYEARVDFARLREYRLARAQQALRSTDCGAFLLFDFYNIRYTTQTWIGGALGDKMIRYALLLRDRKPVEWDFGSAVRHHQLYSQWLPEGNWRPGFLGFRGAVAPEGSDQVEAVNAISGERCNPHPHNFTDRLIRPGDQAFFDIIHSFNGYRTCYYRTFGVGWATPAQLDAYQQAREWMDAALDAIRPGVSSDVVARTLPRAHDFGFDSELAAFGLQFAHGLGLGLHERPIISRLNSLDHPVELQAGMVFAMETYCPAADSFSAARIEEEVVVTDYGTEILTKFPALELPVAARY